ncbi:hypothetical protein [Streptomyces chartreusis]|uniref:hypothetical protein n=1 Tax=Streptomyces chartreusis TaxID=1969 RepID=UPI00123E1056|nr:hypothetical protein [Streptomyces chartreusis]QEV68659.1 hypothetical protein CP983_19595 [Streptomyces chartreusis]GGX50022.1 hypothetical protein GCM10010321_78790 [Streptomyces chartreusis]
MSGFVIRCDPAFARAGGVTSTYDSLQHRHHAQEPDDQRKEDGEEGAYDAPRRHHPRLGEFQRIVLVPELPPE